MHITRVGYAFGIAAAVALAGCSGNGSSMSPLAQTPGSGTQSVVRNHVPTVLTSRVLQGIHAPAPYTGKSWASPNASGTLVYSCGYYANACVWSKPGSNTTMGTLSGLSNPQGVAVDKAGNVYVANTGGSNVLEYAKGSTTLIKTLADTGEYPVDVTVAANGDVYVANIFDTSFNPGSLWIFKSGSTTVTKKLTDPNFYQVISVAVDESKKVVVCYNNSSGVGNCDEFAGAKGHGVNVITGLGFAGGAAFDSLENLAVDDQLNGTKYFTSAFAPCGADPYNSDELFLNFDKSNGDLYKANASNGNLEENIYGGCAGATNEKTFTSGFWTSSDPPFGVAADPGSIQ